MRLDAKVESKIATSARVMQVASMFDVPPSEKSSVEWHADVPIEEKPWSVGLIVGPSGSGKSTAARTLFGADKIVSDFPWRSDRSVLDDFPSELGIKDIVALLSSVGFNTPAAWMRPFEVLSNGEKFRVGIARALAETRDLVVVDEFTSVVDRQVAQVASHCVQKTVRRQKRQLVAVSCHFDVIDWLQPDWIFQPALAGSAGAFQWRPVGDHPPFGLASVRSIAPPGEPSGHITT
ncbi:MAG TPA: hypothetical protein VGI39_05460 [Polyangiaceae bacterium]|jgi:ABC-type ATPase with predicted acetyltransferase domain